MSRQARDWVWTLATVTPPQKFVLLALAERADESGICWPSLSRLSAMTLLARSTVVLALNELEAAGSSRASAAAAAARPATVCTLPAGEGQRRRRARLSPVRGAHSCAPRRSGRRTRSVRLADPIVRLADAP
jgi:DNA-binding MarR family transcriptional regulator